MAAGLTSSMRSSTTTASGRLGDAPATEKRRVRLSIIVPIYNEDKNIPLLFDSLFSVLDVLPHRFEVIAVNDGSRDNSQVQLREAAQRRPELHVEGVP
jgi:cellulose synthase/poly-beta-1,6-N-acetylglucosamine synthase-like glycosyltransferase